MTTCPFCASSITENTIICPSCGATLAGLQLELGFVLFGKYKLEHVLGQGGFGITYQAFDESLNRRVAIKELFPEGSIRNGNTFIPSSSLGANGFNDTKKRFLEEAQTLAQFNHPGIVKVFEVFEAQGTAYIVMEALTGGTLGAQIAQFGTLDHDVVLAIGLSLCDSLKALHGTGLLHRDIKPDNIFLTDDQRVVLIDFGSARGFQTGYAMKHTQLVSPGYAAPEQYASQAKFGTYTDIYGLSATLYHAITGKIPPTASDRVISSNSSLSMPVSVREPLRTALTRGLALRIDERPQTAKDFSSFLKEKNLVEPIKRISQHSLQKSINPRQVVEEVLYRSDDVLITTKRVEITKSNGKTTKKQNYEISEISYVKITNKYIETGIQNIFSDILLFILGILISSWFIFNFEKLDFSDLKTIFPIIFSLLIGVIFCLPLLIFINLTKESNIYYVFILTHLGKRLNVFSGRDIKFAEELVERIRKCIIS